MIDIQSLIDKIPSGNARDPAVLEAYYTWMLIRTQALKRADPSRSKKDCRRIAQNEWSELRRLQKRAERGRPEHTGYWRGARVVCPGSMARTGSRKQKTGSSVTIVP